MKNLPPPNLFLKHIQEYENGARVVRWVSLGLVIVTYPFSSPSGVAVIAVLIATALYNLIPRNRISRVSELAIDHLFAITIISLSGGIDSPYYPVLLLLVIALIASYGVAGFAAGLATQLIVLFILFSSPGPRLPSEPGAQLLIQLTFLITFSLVTVQSVRNRDEEQLIETSYANRLDNERERLLALLNAMADAAIAIDHQGRITQYNGAALALLNTNVPIAGTELGDLLPLNTENGSAVTFLDLTTNMLGSIKRDDLITIREGDDPINLDLTMSAVRVPTGAQSQTDGYILVLRDITRQKSLDEERDEFISVASHELRTPIAIAEANLSTALLPGYAKIEPKAMDLLKQSHDNLVFLGELVQDLTTLSRAQRGDVHQHYSLVDVKTLLTELRQDYAASADTKGLKIKLETPDEPVSIVTGQHEVREVMQNFITNAIKYTDKGKITLRIVRETAGLSLEVQDTGIGIGATDKARVFGKFYRSEDFRTRKTSGTGLGLYISRKLADRLGAKIEFDSKLNQGSTFQLHLPNRDL